MIRLLWEGEVRLAKGCVWVSYRCVTKDPKIV